jgi:hypothetical protein
VRLSDTDVLPFSILDGARVVLGVRNPLDPRFYFAVVHLDDRAFAKDLSGKFETLWREGRFDQDLLKGLLSRRGGKTLLKLGARLKGRA